MATLKIIPDPLGNQLIRTIGSNDPEDLNDFQVWIVSDEDVTGFLLSGITVSSDGTIVGGLRGENSVYVVSVRPPAATNPNAAESGTITVSVATDAVDQGNPQTSLDIDYSDEYVTSDADTPTELFNGLSSAARDIAVTSTRIEIGRTGRIEKYTHAGVEQTSEEIILDLPNNYNLATFDILNGDYLINSGNSTGAVRRVSEDGTVIGSTFIGGRSDRSVFHTPDGIFLSREVQPYDAESSSDVVEYTSDFETLGANYKIAYGAGYVYAFRSNGVGSLYRIDSNANEFQFLGRLDISGSIGTNDSIAIYRDTLYQLLDRVVYTVDISKWRPVEPKTRIDVQFIGEGETLPLEPFAPAADRFIFDEGFEKPSYLSINSSGELAVASNAVTETSPVLVKLRGINRIDSASFAFYLVIVTAENPTWRDVESLSMKASTSYDLHQIVEADSIAFDPDETELTGSSIDNGVFTIDTTAGTAYFRATKNGLTADKAITIDVIQAPDPDNFSDVTRHKVEIAGIDVTADLIADMPLRVDKSLDSVELTRYRAHSVSVPLRNPAGKYNPDRADNFWETNNLNAGGFQEGIKIYLESFINDAWVSTLLFVGILDNQAERFTTAQVILTAKDISTQLERVFIKSFGTLEKWDRLRQQSDEATFEGVYIPEGSLLPVQPESGKAWNDRTELTLRQLQLPSRGVGLANTGYLSENDLRTSGGFLENPPLLNAKVLPRSEDVRFLIAQCALSGVVYNTDIQLTDVELENPTILNRGSVPFSVEDTRITRLPSDWVHDATNDRILMLLSNPEGHIADVLVQYNLNSDSFRTLYTFPKNIKAHRIARRDATNYYILTSGAISQDRSASSLPRQSDSTGYAYDAIAEGSVVRIHHYNASTGTLTEHVPEDNTRPPQLGIHYAIGFENDLHTDEFEGIRPSNRSTFKWVSGNLYYRYATDSEFGVARVNAGGTASEMIDQTTLNYNNHLNFDFDITSGGDIYFVYAVGDADESSLVIKRRTSGGTESTRLTDTQALDALTVLGAQGGVYLGAHECLFYDDDLYILAIIGRVDYDEDADETTRSRTKAAGSVLYRCDVTNANPSLTVLDQWDFATLGGCNLIVHDGAVHFMEQPPAAAQITPINSDLDTYSENMGYNVIPEGLGALKKVESDGSVTELGNLWYNERPYNQAATRALSFDDELHLMMGYGNINELLRYNSLASKADNFVHLVYTTKLSYILPTFSTDGSIYSKLATLARQTGATLSFDGNIISVVTRRAFRAKTNGATGTGTGNLSFDEAKKPFPSSGYLRIGDEFIGYTGISSSAFTGITRGALGSAIVDHADDTGILYLDALFSESDILQLNPQTDTSRLANVIRDNESRFEARDDTSIDTYNEQPYPLNLGLTQNEDAWIETMFAEYLSELKGLGKALSLRLPPRKKSFALMLGQVIGVRYGGLTYALRVESIPHQSTGFNIKGRSVATTL